jgi:hypothetical protein
VPVPEVSPEEVTPVVLVAADAPPLPPVVAPLVAGLSIDGKPVPSSEQAAVHETRATQQKANVGLVMAISPLS